MDWLAAPALAEALVTVLPRYGQMQRAITPHVPALLTLGLPDMRPRVMSQRFHRALVRASSYVERHGGASDRADYRRLEALRPAVTAWSEQLAALPGPPTLAHPSLHPGNILMPGADATPRAKVLDWEGSVVAHPFTSLLIPLRYVQFQQQVRQDDRTLQRLRDAYLEVFSDLAPHADLVTAVELACQMGNVMCTLACSQGRGKRAFQWLRLLLPDVDGDQD